MVTAAARRPPVDVAALAASIRAGERAGLARAITLVESTRTDHRDLAQQLLLEVLPDAGGAHRVGTSHTAVSTGRLADPRGGVPTVAGVLGRAPAGLR